MKKCALLSLLLAAVPMYASDAAQTEAARASNKPLSTPEPSTPTGIPAQSVIPGDKNTELVDTAQREAKERDAKAREAEQAEQAELGEVRKAHGELGTLQTKFATALLQFSETWEPQAQQAISLLEAQQATYKNPHSRALATNSKLAAQKLLRHIQTHKAFTVTTVADQHLDADLTKALIKIPTESSDRKQILSQLDTLMSKPQAPASASSRSWLTRKIWGSN